MAHDYTTHLKTARGLMCCFPTAQVTREYSSTDTTMRWKNIVSTDGDLRGPDVGQSELLEGTVCSSYAVCDLSV